MTSRREGRSISLGRNRDRQARDHSRGGVDEESSTRQNVSNFMVTLQRVQTAEDENRQLRKENQLLRQRARSSRLSSASFSSSGGGPNRSTSPLGMSPVPSRPVTESDPEDKMIEASVKRNSLIFVGDAPVFPQSPEHAALEAQHKKLQTDFDTLKDFLKHLFHHALTMSSSPSPQQERRPTSFYNKEISNSRDKDINTFNPLYSKQLEHSLEDIHGEISQLRNSQDQQQLRMEQVQLALDNVLNQSSVRNDVTMRIVRQQDKMKDMQRHVSYLEAHLIEVTKSLRQAEERLSRVDQVHHNIDFFISSNGKNLKGNCKSDLGRFSDQLSQLTPTTPGNNSKMAVANMMVTHIASASCQGQSLVDSKPPIDVIETISKLERLIGTDWHRFGRMLGLNVDCLDEIGKFTNFDLTTRVEKVMVNWSRTQKGANGVLLKQALTKMDRDILLLADTPISKDICPVPPDVLAFFVAHAVDISSICHSLAWQGVLSQDSISFILGIAEEYKRASRLIHTIVFMGLLAFQTLCHILDVSNQTHVAFKLKGCLPDNGDDNTWEIHSAATLPHHSVPVYKNPVTQTNKKHNTKVDTSILDTSSSSSSSHRPKSREKTRQKRSRSLFTRKNKLRDNDPNDQIVVEHPDITNPQDSFYPVTVV